MTGSRTGFDSGIRHLQTKDNWGPGLVVGGRAVAQAGCGGDEVYAKDNWDPDLYFAKRDREWKATVTVGAIEEQGKPIDKPTQSDAVTPPVDAPADKGVQKQ